MRIAVLAVIGLLQGCTYDFDGFTPIDSKDSAPLDTSTGADSSSSDSSSPIDSSTIDSSAIDSAKVDSFVADTVVAPDTSTSDTGVACTESGAKTYGGHCYFVLASDTWSNGKTACSAKGAHLVTITSGGEQSFVEGVGTGERWIGMSRPVSSPVVEASYVWVTGEAVSYKRWGGGEPGGSGECVVMRVSGSWSDQDCKSVRPVVCERE